MRPLLALAVMAATAAASDHVGLRFEPNQGQAAPRVRFLARTHGLAAAFEDSGVQFADVTLRFAGESPAARWTAADPLPSTSSYFLGADPARWVRNAPHSARLVRRAVYPGIDAVFYGSGDRLEF